MSTLHELGYTIVSYIAICMILVIVGAIGFIWLAYWFFKIWRKEEREHRRNAAYIREQHKRMAEWANRSRSYKEKRSGIRVEK